MCFFSEIQVLPLLQQVDISGYNYMYILDKILGFLSLSFFSTSERSQPLFSIESKHVKSIQDIWRQYSTNLTIPWVPRISPAIMSSSMRSLRSCKARSEASSQRLLVGGKEQKILHPMGSIYNPLCNPDQPGSLRCSHWYFESVES